MSKFGYVARTLCSGGDAICYSVLGSAFIIGPVAEAVITTVNDPRLGVAAVAFGLAALPAGVGAIGLMVAFDHGEMHQMGRRRQKQARPIGPVEAANAWIRHHNGQARV